jgi:hypothetical protein
MRMIPRDFRHRCDSQDHMVHVHTRVCMCNYRGSLCAHPHSHLVTRKTQLYDEWLCLRATQALRMYSSAYDTYVGQKSSGLYCKLRKRGGSA